MISKLNFKAQHQNHEHISLLGKVKCSS